MTLWEFYRPVTETPLS